MTQNEINKKKVLEELGAVEVIPLPSKELAEELRKSYLELLDIEISSFFPYHHTSKRNTERRIERRRFMIMTTQEILDYHNKQIQERENKTKEYVQSLKCATNNSESNLHFP